MSKSSQVILKRAPNGALKKSDFKVEKVKLPPLADGQVLVETLWIAVDPYLRMKMTGRHPTGMTAPGDVIECEAVSRVVESKSRRIKAGTIVRGMSGWRDKAILNADDVTPVETGQLSPSLALSVLGMPGLTAYAGIYDHVKVQKGDVIVVSSAAGVVGSIAGQLAKAAGATVIGLAGGAEKCKWVVKTFGFDACIDYRASDWPQQIQALCPDGPTIYYDNVGGQMLRTMLSIMRPKGRVVLCGIIADYNDDAETPGPTSMEIMGSQVTMSGVIVYFHEAERAAMIKHHSKLIKAGKLKYKEVIYKGLDSAPAALVDLMNGKIMGKPLVQVNK